MGSTFEERSEKERQRNLERFSPLQYQLKKSSGASGQNHSQQNELIGQEKGCYPYPKGDLRQSPKEDKVEDTTIRISIENGVCFKPRELL